jgi:tight adherence protein B
VLTTPAGGATKTDAIRVRENGVPVSGLRVQPAGAHFAVVLAIDASSSMRGQPIHRAMAAARTFAAKRPASQALGVVIFNGSVNVVLSPTTDDEAIHQALAHVPQVQPRTRIFDATAAALRELKGPFQAGAVVVLSDGRDIGSATTAAQIAGGAARHHARLFTIGLRSSSFDPTTLREIAAAGRGEYLGAVRPQELSGVYRRLGGDLSSIYLLRYRSQAPARSAVSVTASGPRLQASDHYKAPQLRVAGAVTASPNAASSDRGFFQTRSGAAVIAVVVALLALVGVMPALRRQQRIITLRNRVSDYGSGRGGVESPSAQVADEGLPRSAEWLESLSRDLELAAIDLSVGQAIARVAAGGALVGLVLAAALGSPLLLVAALVATPFVARSYLRRRISRRREKFADQLSGTVQAVASAMRAGMSFVAALGHVVEDSPEPTASELRRVVADERLGVALDQAFEAGVERMDSRDLRQVALVAVIQRETGGNAAEALDRVVQNIRARDDLRRLIRTLTAQGRIAMRVLVGLPFVTLGGLTLLSPDQMQPLFDTTTGHIALVVAFSMVAVGAVWVRKIVTISM